MKSLKKLLIKKLEKKRTTKKNGAKIWQEETQRGWNQKNNIVNKKIAIKRIKTELERLKNHKGWNWKLFVTWKIIYRLKNGRGEIKKKSLRANPIELNQKK
jgi:hypothetical protein